MIFNTKERETQNLKREYYSYHNYFCLITYIVLWQLIFKITRLDRQLNCFHDAIVGSCPKLLLFTLLRQKNHKDFSFSFSSPRGPSS